MKKLIPALFFIALLSGCDKDNDPVEDTGQALPRYLLKNIEWDYGTKAEFHYNVDSTIKDISFSNGTGVGATEFVWQNKKIIEMSDNRSMYKNVYEYDGSGRLVKIVNKEKSGTLPTSYAFVFTYNAANKVDSLKYYTINEAGPTMQTESSYHYDNAGLLKEIRTKDRNNNLIRHVINSYSGLISFDPAIFISPSLSEGYTFFNLPVISQENRLPTKVTRSVKTGAGAEKVDKIEETAYTLTGYRIDKTKITITFPQHSELNASLEAVYSY